MPIRVLIVDDEALARDTIRLLLENHPQYEVVGECRNGDEAVESIATQRPDLVFLDIQMPGRNGFEVVEAVGVDRMPVVVFATAYDEYALRAFDARALDYLLKPFDDERFERALDRAREQIRQRKLGVLGNELAALAADQDAKPAPLKADDVTLKPETTADQIMVKDRNSIVFVKVDEIDWVEAAGDYVALHVGKKSHLLRETMARMEKRLGERRFVRIHRSTIVQLDRVQELRPYFHGDYIVYLKDGRELRLSRRYWNRVERLLSTGS
ncbi:MAG: two-component system LytT family response regulator [Rhodothermales bacterium]|jgi:two-component system LytT family response regulator